MTDITVTAEAEENIPEHICDTDVQRQMTRRTAIRWAATAAVLIAFIASYTVIVGFIAVYAPK